MFSEIEIRNKTINRYKSYRKKNFALGQEKALNDARNWAEGFFVKPNIIESPNYAKRNQNIIDRTINELQLDDPY